MAPNNRPSDYQTALPRRAKPFQYDMPRFRLCKACKEQIHRMTGTFTVLSYLGLRGRLCGVWHPHQSPDPLMKALTGILSARLDGNMGMAGQQERAIVLHLVRCMTFIATPVETQLLTDST